MAAPRIGKGQTETQYGLDLFHDDGKYFIL